MHLPIAGGIPKLGAKVSPKFDILLIKKNVGSQWGTSHHSKTQSIRTKSGDQIQRVGRVPQRLRHFSPLFIPDNPREIHIAKGHLPHPLKSRHNHPGNPEKNNVRPRNQIRRRIKLRQRPRLLRPSHCRKGPKPRTKPSVQNIRILHKASTIQLFPQRLLIGANEHLILAFSKSIERQNLVSFQIKCLAVAHSDQPHGTLSTSQTLHGGIPRQPFAFPIRGRQRNLLRPHGHPMPPPELPTNAPILNPSQPMIVDLRPTLWEKSHLRPGQLRSISRHCFWMNLTR